MKKLILTLIIFISAVTIGFYLLDKFIYPMNIFLSSTNKPWTTTPGQTCDFSGCSESEMNKIYNYYLQQAVEKKDPSLCKNVKGIDNGDYMTTKAIAVYFCTAEYGGKIGDVSFCQQLDKDVKYPGTASQQYVCYEQIALVATNLETCDELPTDTYPVNVKYECYSQVAERSSDVLICEKIPETGDRNFRGSRKNCLIALGKGLRDPAVCRKLTEDWISTECVTSIAVDLKDSTLCKHAEHQSSVEYCLSAFSP